MSLASKVNYFFHYWFRKLIIKVLSVGPIPYHVAVIMDGNRRYALTHQLTLKEAYAKAVERMKECINVIEEFGEKLEITLYAFSIENFKRSQTEVDLLMNAFRKGLKKAIINPEKFQEKNLLIRFIGNLSMLPHDIQNQIKQLMFLTKSNTKYVLNVAVAYTYRDDNTQTIKKFAKSVKNGELEVSDINENLFDKSLSTGKSPHLDLLIRTSGETRFSDFQMWETTSTIVYFTKVLWPDFTFMQIVYAVIHYQLHHQSMGVVKRYFRSRLTPLSKRAQTFIEKIN